MNFMKKKLNRRDFLKTSSGITQMLAFQGFSPTSFPTSQPKALTNWSRNVQFKPKKIFEPSGIQEVQQLIQAATEIRAVGSGHSFSALVPGQFLVRGSKLKKINLDQASMAVEVDAGVTLKELNRFLAQRGFALPTMGEIDEQTVAGLVATATKGTGIQFGSFSDSAFLLGLSLVDGNGQYQNYDFQTLRESDTISALRMNLGCFGYVLTVKLRICNSFSLREHSFMSDVATAIKEENYLNNYRYAFYYYPHTDCTKMRFQNITTEKVNSDSERNSRNFERNFLENRVADALLKTASWMPSSLPRVEKLFVSTMKNEDFIDHWHEVMVSRRTMRYLEMQYSIPVKNLAQAMKILKTRTDEFAQNKIYYVDLPFFIRFSRADRNILLSPISGDGLYAHIGIHAHLAQGAYELFFQAVENDLVALEGRPHWGKLFYEDASKLYPQIDRFEQERKTFDPKGKFLNEFIKTHIAGF